MLLNDTCDPPIIFPVGPLSVKMPDLAAHDTPRHVRRSQARSPDERAQLLSADGGTRHAPASRLLSRQGDDLRFTRPLQVQLDNGALKRGCPAGHLGVKAPQSKRSVAGALKLLLAICSYFTTTAEQGASTAEQGPNLLGSIIFAALIHASATSRIGHMSYRHLGVYDLNLAIFDARRFGR
jgi:hypothetical protein